MKKSPKFYHSHCTLSLRSKLHTGQLWTGEIFSSRTTVNEHQQVVDRFAFFETWGAHLQFGRLRAVSNETLTNHSVEALRRSRLQVLLETLPSLCAQTTLVNPVMPFLLLKSRTRSGAKKKKSCLSDFGPKFVKVSPKTFPEKQLFQLNHSTVST